MPGRNVVKIWDSLQYAFMFWDICILRTEYGTRELYGMPDVNKSNLWKSAVAHQRMLKRRLGDGTNNFAKFCVAHAV